MSGLSTRDGGQIGAAATLQNCENPRLVDLAEEDVVEMVNDGSPAAKLEERELS